MDKIKGECNIGKVGILINRYYLCGMDWKTVNYSLEEAKSRRLIAKKARLDECRPLPASIPQRLNEEISLEWTYNSNAIEGNTLSLNETRVVLQQGITIGGKTLREHFETINHQKAIDWLTDRVNQKQSLTVKDILHLHFLIMSGIADDFAGVIRTGRVRITGANFIPPNPLKVPELLDELIEWVIQNPQKLGIVELISVFHHRFVWIHPFFDGNGRTARLVMNLLLMQWGFPPVIILKVDRMKYYRALNEANSYQYSKLFLLIFQGLEQSLDRYLNAIAPTDAYDVLPLSDIAKEPDIPYGQEYLSLLARRGELEAFKSGRVWYTTKGAVLHYMSKK